MNTLQKPYYNKQTYLKPSNVKDFSGSEIDSKAASEETFSASFDTPYDIAKKRSSQIPSHDPTTLPPTQRVVSDVPEYELDAQRRKADYHIKLVVVGDGGCGKTCLLISYSQGEFPTVYVPTIFENYVTNVRGPKNKIIELALWDTAGQEEYDRLRPLSYPDVNILLVCYAINNVTSLQNVKETWIPEVRHFCPGIPIILVGTKMDLVGSSNSDIVDFDEAERVSHEVGASAHIRCSAKTTENINHVFNIAISSALKNMEAANAANNDNRKSLKNRFSKQFVKKNEEIRDLSPPPPIYSDYFKNAEYGVSDVPTMKKKKRRCVIL